MTFNEWWENVGKRIQQSKYSSRDEFIQCIARIAWEDAMESSLEEVISFEPHPEIKITGGCGVQYFEIGEKK